jgi:hypothetical protein
MMAAHGLADASLQRWFGRAMLAPDVRACDPSSAARNLIVCGTPA